MWAPSRGACVDGTGMFARFARISQGLLPNLARSRAAVFRFGTLGVYWPSRRLSWSSAGSPPDTPAHWTKKKKGGVEREARRGNGT